MVSKVLVIFIFDGALFKIIQSFSVSWRVSWRRSQHVVACCFMFRSIQLFIPGPPQLFQRYIAPNIRHRPYDCRVRRIKFPGQFRPRAKMVLSRFLTDLGAFLSQFLVNTCTTFILGYLADSLGYWTKFYPSDLMDQNETAIDLSCMIFAELDV